MSTLQVNLLDRPSIDQALFILNTLVGSAPAPSQAPPVYVNEATPKKPAKTIEPVVVTATQEEIKVEPALSGEDLRKAAAAKARELGADGPAKIKAFIATLNVKSIVEVAPEARAGVLARLKDLA